MKNNQPERSVEEIVRGAYEALIHAKNVEGKKRDNYAKGGKLYAVDTYQWIITTMKYLDEYQLTLQSERQRCEEMVSEAYKRGYNQGNFDGSMNAAYDDTYYKPSNLTQPNNPK